MDSADRSSKQPIFFVCLLSLILVTTSARADDLTVPALTAWLDAYGEAWETRDADAAANIFSENATYQVTPYEEPHVGQDGVRSYWAGVTANQRNVQFDYQVLAVTGNTGIAHWTANFDVEGGPNIDLNGVFVLDFDEDGRCRRLREWWHLQSDAAAEQD
ncbi:MAG: nuclear transport factor 2 family protein [Woeseiaceae bacterium]|nr:nuclear transport factor 2 family protein [Woeseiaceae bacterium]